MLILQIRHGARLDAADTQWHLTSPTPYDPPLTYGGWRQSQALGARIASIIHSREEAATSPALNRSTREPGTNGSSEDRGIHNNYFSVRAKRRKHKVVIHTSPFLRCIQTSVAISAGMAQYHGSTKANTHSPTKHAMHSGSANVRRMDLGKPLRLSAIPEPETAGATSRNGGRTGNIAEARTLLRVDAFLGEWLSPDYFDNITPPPESKLMVASAKADLLRCENPPDLVNAHTRVASSQGNFPGGWGSNTKPMDRLRIADEDTPLANLSSLSQSMPRLGRSNTHSFGSPFKRSSLLAGSEVDGAPATESVNYVPPTPSYAISPSQPIPQGYVAHAQDVCVKVDYQWDSLRPPLEWGNGGDFGEEWSSMHKRFRHGLHEMLSWYRGHDPCALVRTLSQGLPDPQSPDGSDDDETETVLVLVTHGAGCNALIGALTNQPVLIDVGMASLTMAVRKSIEYRRVASPSAPSPQLSPSRRRQSAIALGISDDYDVKLIASTDHLRAGSQYLPGSQLQRNASLPIRDRSPYRYERPGFANTHESRSKATREGDGSPHGFDSAPLLQKYEPASSDGSTSAATSSFGGGGGLWSKPVPPKLNKVVEKETKHLSPQKGQIAPFQLPRLDGVTIPTPSNERSTNGTLFDAKRAKSSSENDRQGRSIASSGLWGAPPQALKTERGVGAKRRWTLSQAS